MFFHYFNEYTAHALGSILEFGYFIAYVDSALQ